MRQLFENILQVADPVAVQKLVMSSKVIKQSKGKTLLEAGEIQANLLFLTKGIARGFWGDENGSDITDCFLVNCGDAVLGCNAIGKRSKIAFETISDCEFVCIEVSELQKLMREYPAIVNAYNYVLTEALERNWEIRTVMCQYSAMQRYLWFLQKFPGLIEQVCNKHVASFLCMTSVTLSRLRRQLREETY